MADDTLCGIRVPRIGLLWMAVSAWGYATASLFARLASANATSWQVVFTRCVLQWCFAVGYQKLYHPDVDLWGPPEVRKSLVLRGGFGVGGLSCFYYAITVLPLSDATVLMFTSPVWTCIIAWVILGEKIGLPEFASLVISVAGICFIAKPTFLFPKPRDAMSLDADSEGESEKTLGLLVGVLGSVFAACAYVTIRYVSGALGCLPLTFLPLMSRRASVPNVRPALAGC